MRKAARTMRAISAAILRVRPSHLIFESNAANKKRETCQVSGACSCAVPYNLNAKRGERARFGLLLLFLNAACSKSWEGAVEADRAVTGGSVAGAKAKRPIELSSGSNVSVFKFSNSSFDDDCLQTPLYTHSTHRSSYLLPLASRRRIQAIRAQQCQRDAQWCAALGVHKTFE